MVTGIALSHRIPRRNDGFTGAETIDSIMLVPTGESHCELINIAIGFPNSNGAMLIGMNIARMVIH